MGSLILTPDVEDSEFIGNKIEAMGGKLSLEER